MFTERGGREPTRLQLTHPVVGSWNKYVTTLSVVDYARLHSHNLPQTVLQRTNKALID